MPEPTNRTILLFDIEGFGKHDDVQQTFMRRVLYDVVRETLERAEVEQTALRLEDRGDSVLSLIDPAVPKTRLLKALLTETPAILHGYNRVAASSTQVRLRIVLASGEVALHEIAGVIGGVVGGDLNQAFRLLNSDVLRVALRDRTGQSVLCVSESVYRGTVRHGYPGVRPEEFQEVLITGKEGQLSAWVHGAPPVAGTPPQRPSTTGEPTDAHQPTGQQADQRAEQPPGAGNSIQFLGGSPSFGGSLIAGPQTMVSGGQVTGDVVFGNKSTDKGSDEQQS
ncbi:hypothetical protein ACEZCY_11315 [Streptacidiphilus sp. N1-12]|uniref:Guanylate cyclase domain-containing protein n=2 Tax=Streptacidiphilus alkalitolerans TaxID=3342712 RepID=A0ABV6V6A8_9ACTN